MESLLTPDNVLRLWGRAPAADKAFAAQERAAHVARVGARVREGTYPDAGAELDGAVDKLLDAMHKPDLAERERAEFDRQNDGERFDGLS